MFSVCKKLESAFVQQKLPTHRLSWTPYRVCPCLLLMGALFIGFGIGIKRFSDNIQEVIIPYTDCISIDKPGYENVFVFVIVKTLTCLKICVYILYCA